MGVLFRTLTAVWLSTLTVPAQTHDSHRGVDNSEALRSAARAARL